MNIISGKTVRAWFTIVLLIIGSIIQAQNTYITISGVLKDSKSFDRVAYATITVPGTGIGTVSNSDGEFTLKLNADLKADHFEVTHISYATALFSINDAQGKEREFFLELQPVQLKEIPVFPADARSLVQKALVNIPENYSQVPNMMTGFYREYVMQRKDYLSVSEAVVDIYKAPYTGIQDDQVKIFKGRKASNVRKADTLLVQLQGGPKVLMLLDIMKNPDLSIAMDNLDNYDFEFNTVVNIDNKPHWVVNFSPSAISEGPLYFGKLYIRQDNMAISRAEFSLDLRDQEKAAGAFVKKKPLGMIFNPTSTSYLVTYKEENGKYYLSYVRVDLKFKCDWKKKLFKNNYALMSEMAITGRSEDHIVKFENQETFKTSMVLAEKVEDFNDVDFWGEHNIIQPEESIENAIKKLSKSMNR